MPNTCLNTLTLTGDPEDVRKFLAAIGSPEHEDADQRLFDLDRIVPLPPDLWARGAAPEAEPVDGISLLTEVVKRWGTKWNAYNVTIDVQPDGGTACIKFSTAWTSPEPVLATLARRFGSLEFDLTYVDMQFPMAGRWRRSAGDDGWVCIIANGDYGFCRAALGASPGPLD